MRISPGPADAAAEQEVLHPFSKAGSTIVESAAILRESAAKISASPDAWWPHTGPVLLVREAQPQDAAEVAGVNVRSWQMAYRGLFPDDYLDGLRAEDRMAHYTFGDVRPGCPVTLVAVVDATICGFATIGPSQDEDAPDAGQLYAIYLDPQAWGRGIGRVLIAEARTRLSRQGFTEAILWVHAGNEQAQRFYRADGWQPDGHRRQEYVWGVLADEVRYRRCLP